MFSSIALTPAAHNESLKCERLKMQKDRRRPDTCHPFHPEVQILQRTITHYKSCFVYLWFKLICSHNAPLSLSRKTPWSVGELWILPSLSLRRCSAYLWRCSPGDQSWPCLSTENFTWLGLARHAKESQWCHRKKQKNKTHSCPIYSCAQFQLTTYTVPSPDVPSCTVNIWKD